MLVEMLIQYRCDITGALLTVDSCDHTRASVLNERVEVDFGDAVKEEVAVVEASTDYGAGVNVIFSEGHVVVECPDAEVRRLADVVDVNAEGERIVESDTDMR